MSYRDLSVVERLVVLETKFETMENSLKKIEVQLEDLLTLREKGMGAFWVASSLLGTGIVGVVIMFINWVRG